MSPSVATAQPASLLSVDWWWARPLTAAPVWVRVAELRRDSVDVQAVRETNNVKVRDVHVDHDHMQYFITC